MAGVRELVDGEWLDDPDDQEAKQQELDRFMQDMVELQLAVVGVYEEIPEK